MTTGPLTARWFRVIAVVEAVSWTALLVAMFFKHVLDAPYEGGVPVVGMIHGIGFVVYELSALLAARRFGWSLGTVVLGLLAGFVPLGTVLFERAVQRRGLLPLRVPARAAQR